MAHKSRWGWILSLVFMATAGRAVAGTDELLLIDERGAQAVVIHAADGPEEESLAVRELNDHLKKMSGKDLPVIAVAPAEAAAAIRKAAAENRVAVVIGSIAMDDAIQSAIEGKGTDSASFVLSAENGVIKITGLSPQATLFGVYELLEQLGCRWYMPGDFGTVIPQAPVVRVRVQQTIQVPAFAGRTLQMLENQTDWYRRMRLGGKPVPGAHGIDIGEVSIEKTPELFAIYQGKRASSQFCISNPEVLRLAIEQTRKYFRENPDADMVGMGPGDGREFCECERCVALDAGDWDPFAKIVSITDRYVWFFNSVLAAIADEFPDKSLAFYAYDGTMRPPVRETPNRRIIPTFALIRVCHLHGMSNPICPERGYYRTLLTQWSKLVDQSFDRDYLLNYSGFPISHVDRSRDELPTLQRMGITRVRRQTWPCWGNMTPGIYITAKLLWNTGADVDALEQDFYDRFFGGASAPMARYFERLDRAYREVDHHPRWEVVDMGQVLPPDAMKACRADLDEAVALASDETIAGRVAAFRLMHDELETHQAAIGAQDRFDFVTARSEVNGLVELQNQAMQHNPPLQNESTTKWLQHSIEDAYAKTTGDNELLAGVDSTWDFLTDPVRVGEDLQYWSPTLRGGNWTTRPLSSIALKAIVSDWDGDLRWYSGDAWYRNTIRLPAVNTGTQKVHLWFRRLPEGSKVWLNGRQVGEVGDSTGRLTPFEIDVTEAIAVGQENVIAVRATGPMGGPVMFHASKPPSP